MFTHVPVLKLSKQTSESSCDAVEEGLFAAGL